MIHVTLAKLGIENCVNVICTSKRFEVFNDIWALGGGREWDKREETWLMVSS